MHSSLLTDTESDFDAYYGYQNQTRGTSSQSPSSSYTSYSSASVSFSVASTSSRYGRNYGRSNRSGRKMGLYGSGYEEEEEEDEMDLADEGYDSYDASPRFQTRSSRRLRTASPRQSPFSAYSTPCIPLCPSPSFSPVSSSFPYSNSLPLPEELEDVDVLSSDSNSSEEIERNYTPSCNEALRRQWLALALRVRIGVFRAQRKMRGFVGKGRKY
ncbi:hypothetical protein BDP27DRAFT_213616 [Rhodocollybia butyracea]|uniref:Uncharacterized protein n=1 Tax=Rhodocollybia butyracea TaxID=206335 RepID=A0A9P5PKV9_9AGAR|nr:hypothetical protein BDP27DRAFT_213616 [Rhodocollybia butyracea]